MNVLQRTIRSWSTTRWARWVVIRTARPLDTRLKDTRLAPSTVLGVPLCYLTTTGRKTGQPRQVPLLYARLDDTAAVVATNYGQEHHPAWSYNLDANPRATLEIDGLTTPVVARRTTDEEQALLWPDFESIWPGYEQYRRIAPRDIKMYLLEPSNEA